MTLCDPEAASLYRHAAVHLAREGHVVVTLPVRGACQLAAEAALVVGGSVELMQPYEAYEEEWVTRIRQEHGKRVTVEAFDAELHQEWTNADHLIHPGHKHLGGPDDAHHATICGAVERGDAAIILPHGEEAGYEAVRAIRIARALDKPLLVLSKKEDREQLEAML